jgi:hypothetical protein
VIARRCSGRQRADRVLHRHLETARFVGRSEGEDEIPRADAIRPSEPCRTDEGHTTPHAVHDDAGVGDTQKGRAEADESRHERDRHRCRKRDVGPGDGPMPGTVGKDPLRP